MLGYGFALLVLLVFSFWYYDRVLLPWWEHRKKHKIPEWMNDMSLWERLMYRKEKHEQSMAVSSKQWRTYANERRKKNELGKRCDSDR